jgi:HD-GYP domain-containing protein (c-di-GMP phosphodiesterase class II)
MDIPQLREVLPGVRQHHERWDGKGYPFALGGDQISILGRVVGIADAFDAMTSARFYRPARQVQEVLDEVARCAGTHFDPELAKVFAAIPVAELLPLVAPPVSPTDPAAALKRTA